MYTNEGTCKMRNEIETKRNEIETKLAETFRFRFDFVSHFTGNHTNEVLCIYTLQYLFYKTLGGCKLYSPIYRENVTFRIRALV